MRNPRLNSRVHHRQPSVNASQICHAASEAIWKEGGLWPVDSVSLGPEQIGHAVPAHKMPCSYCDEEGLLFLEHRFEFRQPGAIAIVEQGLARFWLALELPIQELVECFHVTCLPGSYQLWK